MNVQKTGLSILLLQIIMLGSKLDSRKFNFGTLGPRPPPSQYFLIVITIKFNFGTMGQGPPPPISLLVYESTSLNSYFSKPCTGALL